MWSRHFGRFVIVVVSAFVSLTVMACGSDSTAPDGPDTEAVSSVTVTPNLVPLVPQQTAGLTASVLDASGNPLSGRQVTWTSSSPGTVSLTPNGMSATITALAAGTATITATSEGKSGSATITVNEGGYIGPNGGQVTAAGGALRIQVPAGALGAPLAITVSPLANPPAGEGLIQGTAYDLGPNGSGFSQPVTVTIRYEASAVPQNMDPALFRVHRWNGSAWEPLGSPAVNVATREVSGTTTTFSAFAVLGVPGSPAPTLTSIDPSSAFSGSGDLTLTVAGTDFVESSVVRWNGSDRPTTFVSATQLLAAISAADLENPGQAQVTVFTPSPGGGTSEAVEFTIIPAPGSAVAKISSGVYHVCGVDVAGVAYCWGNNDGGRLGNGVPGNSPVPVAVSGGQTYKLIATGEDHTCAITANGAAYCWGVNDNGQLGNGNKISSDVPVAVMGGHTFKAIGTGTRFSCGLTTAGAAYCWGSNIGGQLGVGGSMAASQTEPVPVVGGHTFHKLAVGSRHACALTEEGQAYCWGSNQYGRLGDGTSTVFQLTPVAVTGNHEFVDITAGAAHTCALERDGDAFCWGHNEFGQVGDATFTDRNAPVPVAGSHTWIALHAGGNTTCGVVVDGSAYCWGDGSWAQLGTSMTSLANEPVPVESAEEFSYVVPGTYHACGVTTTGQARCWGFRSYGQLATGNAAYFDPPVRVAGGHAFTRVDVNTDHTCAVTSDNAAYCWGIGNTGQLGNGSVSARNSPVAVVGDHEFVAVTTGNSHSCGLDSDGRAWCWGYNQQGQLGDGTNQSSNVPVAVTGNLHFTEISAGFRHTCGLTNGGQVYCWGSDSDMQLGLPTFDDQNKPTLVSFGAPVVITQISAGDRHTCARASTGAVYCWGNNNSGQVGSPGVAQTPKLVGGNHNFASVTAGWHQTCGILNSGSVLCWGYNGGGRLGVGDIGSTVTTPQPVLGLDAEITQIAIGDIHLCALATGGKAYCWGRGTEGQLGTGTTGDRTSPTEVAGGLLFKHIDAGVFYTCGTTSTGDAYCWGWQTWGELGNNGVSYDFTPVPAAAGILFAEP